MTLIAGTVAGEYYSRRFIPTDKDYRSQPKVWKTACNCGLSALWERTDELLR